MSFFNPVELETRSIREAIQKTIPFVNGRVLDVGCGDKPYKQMFEGCFTEYVGVDLETVNASRADVFADSIHLPFRASSFDTVFSTQVIEHVQDPFQMMKEIREVLKVGGHVIVTAPQVWPIHEAPHDFFRYTRFGLEQLAKQSGLEVVEIRERHGGVYALAQMLCFMIYMKHRASRVLRALAKPLFFVIQALAPFLDRVYYYPDFTLGYLMVARKPA